MGASTKNTPNVADDMDLGSAWGCKLLQNSEYIVWYVS